MSDKRKRKVTSRDAKVARLKGTATMTTEPFEPQAGADIAGDTAPIAPVTPDMLDHAAHKAAEAADAVAHAASDAAAHDAPAPEAPAAEPVDAAAAPSEPEPPVPAPGSAPIAEAAAPLAALQEIPAAAAEATSRTLRAADLAFNHGSGGSAREGFARATDNVGRFNAKIVEIAAGNVAAAGELVTALMAAKSVPEAAAINADHLRRRLDTLTTQGRELLVLAQRAAFDALRPTTEDARKP